jgi:hypothetical protein
MANRSRLLQISSKKDDSPNHFSKGTIKEEELDILIPITADTFLTTFPIFIARLSLVRTTSLCRNQRKFFIFSGILIFRIFL